MTEAADGQATAGGLLRQAREASGMHIAALAGILKVPVSKLEALEADDHSVLTDTVFVRALAASVCRTLKVDAAPVLALLPQNLPRLSANGAGINAPVKSSAASATAFPGSASRSVILVVLALLLGALLLFFYPRHPPDAGVTPAPADAPATTGSAADPAAQAPTAASDMAAVPEPPAAGMAGSAAVHSSAAMAPASATAAQVVAGAGVGAGSAQLLVLRARSQSWVQVRDATGALALQRTLSAGESVSVAAPTPLSVVVGRADGTEALVRGNPFDLRAVARDNVARFEVK
ncbi:helix-turn-helix domain-containing protein [Verminephrobacter eiseniae]|uniref:helix-turn-helix domain-containing protein n=1 Tax=Verminephrobacter eiseniae TaxID=364317 RepID=UPI00223892BD|nr:helix-turn-helix domain-containing protein [Verminephrobacter eiseniae]MCW5261089.1 helix-turn-helix domain-containing protein [Verminephrobacter eiseniae]MCW5295525.1 helix-turn-helix domain-containing protein [Verminephrobacter eiseniae]MCW8184450.1 helix-turn-helix domain-containing protein [Verminephrobacter eiseniae]MCW8223704.1 helix-turn-helix domain-containing protein [Verminephrobacter eiseniae]MCW8232880.1 helix-turn-helix domain-containing protein [Verminephrobacter eiseniae]